MNEIDVRRPTHDTTRHEHAASAFCRVHARGKRSLLLLLPLHRVETVREDAEWSERTAARSCIAAAAAPPAASARCSRASPVDARIAAVDALAAADRSCV